MLAYNGSIPGPTLRVPQGAEVVVHVLNDGDLETTVHWHGLRLDNAYDGTHEVQAPIPVGGSFTYRVRCPDPGVYWYHPHVREDYGQELGPLRLDRRRPRRPGLLAAGPSRARPDARRRARRGRQGGAVRRRADVRRDGPLRERDARQRRERARARGAQRRGAAALPDEHRQHARLQRRARRARR